MSNRITNADIDNRLAELNEELPLPVGWTLERNSAHGRTSIDLEHNHRQYAQFVNGTKQKCYDVAFGDMGERALYRVWSTVIFNAERRGDTLPTHPNVILARNGEYYTVEAFGITRTLYRWNVGALVYAAWKLSQV